MNTKYQTGDWYLMSYMGEDMLVQVGEYVNGGYQVWDRHHADFRSFTETSLEDRIIRPATQDDIDDYDATPQETLVDILMRADEQGLVIWADTPGDDLSETDWRLRNTLFNMGYPLVGRADIEQ